MNEQFTLEGRRILDEKSNGGELQQLIDYVHGPIWICTCAKLGCEHLVKSEPIWQQIKKLLHRQWRIPESVRTVLFGRLPVNRL